MSVQAQLLNTIKDLQARNGFSAVFISHDLAATRYVASRIAVLYAGRLVEDAPATRFYETAAHPYSQGLQFASALIDDAATELKLGQVDLNTAGCLLASRCPMMSDMCHQIMPAMKDSADGSRLACHNV